VEEGVEEGVKFFRRAEAAHGFPPEEDGRGCIVGDAEIEWKSAVDAVISHRHMPGRAE
jgi:hypothetical protein